MVDFIRRGRWLILREDHLGSAMGTFGTFRVERCDRPTPGRGLIGLWGGLDDRAPFAMSGPC